MTIVSNSDIETSQKCEKMFEYSRIRKLRPRNLPVNLKRGIFGHQMMEKGFDVLISGGTLEQATEAAAVVLSELLSSGDPDMAEMMGVYRHVCAFLSYSISDKCHWRPIATEVSSMWNITDGAPISPTRTLAGDERVFAFTPDLIVEFVSGPYRGQQAVLDYKFLGQYMKERALNMSQQIPKYILYYRKLNPNTKLRMGAFVQLNTRAQKNDTGHKLFLIKWIEPTKREFQEIELDNEIAVERVAQMYDEPNRRHPRTSNKDVCNWCFFADDLCPMERNGQSVEKIIERNYVFNDYGYDITAE